MLCEFYLDLKLKKKEEEEKERSGKFSLITIRTQVETGLVWVNGSQMGTWTAPSPPRRWAALSRSAGGILAFGILTAQDVTSGNLGNVQVLEDAVAGALVQVFREYRWKNAYENGSLGWMLLSCSDAQQKNEQLRPVNLGSLRQWTKGPLSLAEEGQTQAGWGLKTSLLESWRSGEVSMFHQGRAWPRKPGTLTWGQLGGCLLCADSTVPRVPC